MIYQYRNSMPKGVLDIQKILVVAIARTLHYCSRNYDVQLFKKLQNVRLAISYLFAMICQC